VKGVYSVADVRSAEDAAGSALTDGTLMQRAATALAAQCARALRERTGRVYGSEVVLLVGAGNNGGDALYAGAALARRGASVSALLTDPERAHVSGLGALHRAGGRVGTPAAAPDLVVDGLVGIGGRGGLAGRAAELCEAYAEFFTVSVDLPSGVDADTGAMTGIAVRADVTVTFGCLKTGVVVGDGADAAGELHLAEIGFDLPPARTNLLEAHDVAAVLPEPNANDDKYTRGVVGVLAGSAAYPGAGVLATGAALSSSGYVRYAGRAPETVRARYPEVVVSDPGAGSTLPRAQAWIIGPGLGVDAEAQELLQAVLATDLPVIVDADAITLLGGRLDWLRRDAPTVLTPHDREFVRLAPDTAGLLQTDRLGAARAAAASLGAVVLLKGAVTVIAQPDAACYVNPTGTPWLATAGTGDVLAGLIGSLLANGLPAGLAAATGAYVHGVAGQVAAESGPPSAGDVLAALRPALNLVRRS
jgi:hydroxyethylthiazole kinase-like uncharacterized protein yjeF